MADNQEIYTQLAKSLTDLFFPMAEIALYKASQRIAIFNRLTNETLPNIEVNTLTKILINKNQQAKFLIVPLGNNYSLRILVDTTVFDSLHNFLNKFQIKQHETENPVNWQDLVETIIGDYLQKQQTSLAALNAQEKRNLILILKEKELLKYQDATKYLACKLNVSRATIYNYIFQANQFKSLEIHQVDAFTNEAFSGNPAGVVLDANDLSDQTMKKIAREMNLSETSFMLKSTKADIKLRYFTPSGSEVKFCGHSTVGALYMLAHKKLLGITKPGNYPINIETQVGIIASAITLDKDEKITVQFHTPKIKLINTKWTHSQIADYLGIPLASIDSERPIMFETTNRDLFITITSLKKLKDLQIDMESTKRFSEKNDIVAIALLCNQTISKNNHLHMRCFAPAVGISEDPFTGSVLGGLAHYVTKTAIIPANLNKITVEQGHFMHRPGSVDMILHPEDGQKTPLIIAKAHHFFSTKINL